MEHGDPYLGVEHGDPYLGREHGVKGEIHIRHGSTGSKPLTKVRYIFWHGNMGIPLWAWNMGIHIWTWNMGLKVKSISEHGSTGSKVRSIFFSHGNMGL